MAQVAYDENFSAKRMSYFISEEFKELLEELNINMEHVDGEIRFNGSKNSIEQLQDLIAEFDSGKEQPGKDTIYMSEKTHRVIEEQRGFSSLDSLLDEKYKITNEELTKRNKLKSLDRTKTEKEVDELEKEYEELNDEILLITRSIQKKKKALESINKYIEEKMDLILNKVITDPDEIASIQEEIEFKSKQASDIVEDLDKDSKFYETKNLRKEAVRHAIEEKRRAMEEARRAIEEDERTKKRQQEELDAMPRRTVNRLID